MSFNAALGLSAEDVRVLEQMRTRFYPLVYNLEQLLAEMAANPEPLAWNAVLRYSSLAKSHVRSIFEYFNEPVARDGEPILTDEGKQVTVSDVLASLDPYPVAPFPVEEKADLLKEMLSKHLGGNEEAYVDERVRAAADFCRVPPEWGIVPPRKAQVDDESDDSGKIKREVTNLDEDEVTNIWRLAGAAVGDEYVFFEKVIKGSEDPDYDSDDEDAARIKEMRKKLHLEGETPDSTPAAEAEGQAPPTEKAPLPIETLLRFASRGAV